MTNVWMRALALATVAAAAWTVSAAAQDGAAPAEGAAETAAEEAAVKVLQVAVCRDVEDRKPVGEAKSFGADVGGLYCFTWVETTDAPTEIYHRWYVGDRLVNEIPIRVKGERWRCWSRKTILPQWEGTCRVDIASEEGDILASHEFTLTAAS